MSGCGHGECTVEETCKYVEAQKDVRWGPDDLDRCVHGRHSIDPCVDCGGLSGLSMGNQFLTGGVHVAERMRRRRRDDNVEVRIGTMVHGEPIWVMARRAIR